MLDFTAATAEAARTESIAESVTVLLKQLFDDVEANKNAPAALQSLVDRGRQANDKLVASLTTYTPVA